MCPLNRNFISILKTLTFKDLLKYFLLNSFKSKFLRFRFQKNKIVKLMVLTNSFSWENLPLTRVDSTKNMTAMVARIKKTVKQIYWFIFFFHGTYTATRLIFNEQPVFTVNSFYIVDVSRSPVYEMILLSQVRRL